MKNWVQGRQLTRPFCLVTLRRRIKWFWHTTTTQRAPSKWPTTFSLQWYIPLILNPSSHKLINCLQSESEKKNYLGLKLTSSIEAVNVSSVVSRRTRRAALPSSVNIKLFGVNYNKNVTNDFICIRWICVVTPACNQWKIKAVVAAAGHSLVSA